jgi:hypothetical protein
MKNISKVIIGCSAISLASLTGFVPSALSQTTPPVVTNGSNATGGNVTSYNGSNAGGGNGGNVTNPGFSPATVGRAGTISSRFTAAQTNFTRASEAVRAIETQPVAAAKSEPVRYGREVADVASCGCPNADTTSASTPTNRPELVAAKAAEAEAAAELAAAQAEAKQFVESVKNEKSSQAGSSSPIW